MLAGHMAANWFVTDMAKKPKLFHAFVGDAPGLRDALIERFKDEQARMHANLDLKGEDYAAGLDVGKWHAYGDVIAFLKKLVINDNEHPESEA